MSSTNPITGAADRTANLSINDVTVRAVGSTLGVRRWATDPFPDGFDAAFLCLSQQPFGKRPLATAAMGGC
jgi:hypothetical protein